ncbi:CheR family methyltransferase [Planctomicrobium sp. SH668]|uniref:CheR family methyltransferase n=1 Tax=Planctomicrobium sp. SH668 TaxID=3448126 RepID=UPI003F5AE876
MTLSQTMPIIRPLELPGLAQTGNTSSDVPLVLDKMSNAWWEQMRAALEHETGMDLGGTRGGRFREAVKSALAKFNAPTEALIHEASNLVRFIEVAAVELTIGESFFLRNENHMGVLKDVVFPNLLKENASRREIRIWSAGCAGGEEPYSLAILLDSLMDRNPGWQISVLGTDLNPSFLERGRAATYRKWSFRQTSIQEDARYFRQQGDTYVVCDRIRQQVRFQYLNLVKDAYPSSLNGTVGLDLILFRNVAIYLKAEVTAAILNKLLKALRPGGWLLLGEIEVTLAPTSGYEVHRFPHATFYRRPLNETAGGSVPSSFEHHVPPSLAAPAPVSIPVVPPLPQWAPLPTDRIEKSLEIASPPVKPVPLAPLTVVEQLQQNIRQTVDVSLRSTYRLALIRKYLEAAQVNDARIELGVCLKENPLLAEGYLLQAGMAEDAGDLALAEQSYRKVLYLERGNALAHLHLGLVQQQKGDLTGWQRSMKTARELAEKRDPLELVEYGDGVCYGRLHEMILLLVGGVYE